MPIIAYLDIIPQDSNPVLQFTTYMDYELEAIGFPRQSLEHKRGILEAMGLAITNWQRSAHLTVSQTVSGRKVVTAYKGSFFE